MKSSGFVPSPGKTQTDSGAIDLKLSHGAGQTRVGSSQLRSKSKTIRANTASTLPDRGRMSVEVTSAGTRHPHLTEHVEHQFLNLSPQPGLEKARLEDLKRSFTVFNEVDNSKSSLI